MFQMEIENPLDETVRPLFDFKMIELKFKTTVVNAKNIGYRTQMKIEALDVEFKDWMNTYLTMENGLIEFTVPKTGNYEIAQHSASSNRDSSKDLSVRGPAMGVTIELETHLNKVKTIL